MRKGQKEVKSGLTKSAAIKWAQDYVERHDLPRFWIDVMPRCSRNTTKPVWRVIVPTLGA